MEVLRSLRERLAELSDLGAVEMLVEWDQLVMMPSQGAAARAQQLGTLARLSHERATAADIGEWLAELEPLDLDDLDRDIVRLARRDWERARRVPDELAVELARAGTDGQERWQLARAEDDFAAFAPALERNVQLAREYASCLAQEGESRYDAMLGDYDFGLRTEELRRVFGRLAHELAPPRPARTRPGARSRFQSRLSRRPSQGHCAASALRTRAGGLTSPPIPSPPGSAPATRA
jgi:carboxypeptidase Taq